jgi:hypothetical protein
MINRSASDAPVFEHGSGILVHEVVRGDMVRRERVDAIQSFPRTN